MTPNAKRVIVFVGAALIAVAVVLATSDAGAITGLVVVVLVGLGVLAISFGLGAFTSSATTVDLDDEEP